MGKRVNKLEPFKSVYVVERSAYRLNHEDKIVHLRMLSPDRGKTHVEYFSYIIQRGIDVLTTQIENKVLEEMEYKMHVKIGNTIGIQQHKTMQLKRQVELLEGAKE